MNVQLPPTFYSHVKVDIPHELMKHVIGKNGKWFHFTSQQCGVNYIWFNKKRNIVEIWGPTQNLMYAVYGIQTRINYIKNRFTTPELIQEYSKDIHWPVDEYCEYNLNETEHKFNPEMIRFLIGKNGKNFKKITRESGVSFLWYNKYNNSVCIWGPRVSIDTAIFQLKESMYHINQLATNKSTNSQSREELFVNTEPDAMMSD